MSKRQKIDWTPVLKLVLLVGNVTTDWGVLLQYRQISSEINRYILDDLLYSGSLFIHCTFEDHEPGMLRQRFYVPRPVIFKYNREMLIGTVTFPLEHKPDVVFYTIIKDGHILIDTTMSASHKFKPCPAALVDSYIYVRAEFKDRVLRILGTGFDMDRDGCRKCNYTKNDCQCLKNT